MIRSLLTNATLMHMYISAEHKEKHFTEKCYGDLANIVYKSNSIGDRRNFKQINKFFAKISISVGLTRFLNRKYL